LKIRKPVSNVLALLLSSDNNIQSINVQGLIQSLVGLLGSVKGAVYPVEAAIYPVADDN